MDYDSKVNLSSILSTRAYWTEWIFDRAASGIQVRLLDAFFLSCIAACIICFEKSPGGVLRWNLVWQNSSTPHYQLDECWDGINVKAEGQPRQHEVTSQN